MGVLNVAGFYDGLLAFFDTAVAEGFVTSVNRDIVIAAPTAAELLDKLQVSTGPVARAHRPFICPGESDSGCLSKRAAVLVPCRSEIRPS